MKNIDREELNILEHQQIEEYQVFEAELINVKENINVKNEEFKVKEIEKVSTFEPVSKENVQKKAVDTDSLFKKIRNTISNSATSITTTIGSTVMVGAVGAAVVLTPIIEPDLFGDPIEEVAPTYKYTLTYEAGDVYSSSIEMVVDILALPLELPKLELDGYKFEGWYYDAEFINYAVGGTEITKDTTLYAKWTELYTITYDINGIGDAVSIVENVLELPNTLPLLEAEGYRFDGWYMDALFTTKAEAGQSITKDTTLYAKWTDYGDVTILNYSVDTNSDLTKNIVLITKTTLIEGYSSKFVNIATNDEFEISSLNPEISITNLSGGEQTFEIRIFDSNNQLVQAIEYKINTESIEYISDLQIQHLITYNYPESDEEELSSNIYYYPIFDDSLGEVITEVELYDLANNKLNYTAVNDNGVYSFTYILEEAYTLVSKSYVIVDGNKYVVNNSTYDNISSRKLDFEVEADYDKYKISIDALTDYDVQVVINDDTNIVSSSDVNYGPFIVYYDIVESAEITIRGYFNLNDSSDKITNYIGDPYGYFEASKTVSQVIVNSIEHVNTFVTNDNIKFEFEGYVDDEYTVKMNIYDAASYGLETAVAIESYDYSRNSTDYSYQINLMDPVIYFSDFTIFPDDTIEYTFEFILYDAEGNIVNETPITCTNKVIVPGSSYDINSQSPNCGDVYVTYNEDDTFNAYFYINTEIAEGATEDYKVMIILKNTDTDEVYKYIGTDKVAVIENIPYGSYGLTYYKVIIGGDNLYYTLSETVVSGAVDIKAADASGAIETSNYIFEINQNSDDESTTEIDESKTYELEFYNCNIEPDSDVTVYVTLYTTDAAGDLIQSEVVTIVIPYADLESDMQDTLDLSSYNFTTATFDIKLYCNYITSYKSNIDDIIGIDGYKGSHYKLHKLTNY